MEETSGREPSLGMLVIFGKIGDELLHLHLALDGMVEH